MATTINQLTSENSILYELFVYSEWKQDPELPKITSQHNDGFGSIFKVFSFYQQKDAVNENVSRLLSWQQPWRLAVGDGGKVVAVIQDVSLEIRSSRDEYSSIIGKAALPKDPFSQWRRWCWSPDYSILAVGFTNGCVCAYDLMGSNLFTIYPPGFQQDELCVDTHRALASCFFIQARVKSHKWSSELVCVDYNGQLSSYLVSPTEGFQENHTFSLSQYYRQGITAVTYHQAHSMLFVAGPVGACSDPLIQDHGRGLGLTAWRILNDHPFYQLVQPDKKKDGALLSDSLWNSIPTLRKKRDQSTIIRMEISPSGRLLAAIHACGSISLWTLPGLRKFGFWPLFDQPGWNCCSPSLIQQGVASLGGKKATTSQIEEFLPTDLDWWSEEALVIARRGGAVSVCDIKSLGNKLGENPEFLAGAAQVKRLHSEEGFLALECEIKPVTKNRDPDITLDDDTMESTEDEDEEDAASASLVTRAGKALGSAAYMITDMERFRPKRKKLRLFRRTYRLLALRSTTPEELYNRKLDNEDYGEALTLAHAYNLDCDKVYQRQWKNNKVSVATIRDYLSKVSNRTWVLFECVSRVPESLLAARELIDFGLKATTKDVLKSLGNKKKIRDVGDLNNEQRELLVFRRTLLHYLDCLTTYEKILGGPELADELFEHSFYAKFRISSSLRACIQFARAANWQAVECMFTYHGSSLLEHWLPILSNFPETVCPTDYKSLLPELIDKDRVFVWQTTQLRSPDWSEKSSYSLVKGLELSSSEQYNEYFYEGEPNLSSFRVKANELTAELVTRWYQERIRAIESSSRMVDNSLILLRLAQDRNIEGLESLHQELQTLDVLVYELFLEDITLSDLEKKSSLDKCRLLMSKTSEKTFINDFNNFLVPFVARVGMEGAGKRNLIHDYLVGLACEDLTLPNLLFESIRDNYLSVLSLEDVMSLAVACLYAYVGTDQLELAENILICLPADRECVHNSKVEHQIKEVEEELKACLILESNLTPKSLGYIRDNKHDVQTATQLLTRMARTVANSKPTMSEKEWAALLSDILDLQQHVFTCVPLEKCFEVYSSALLSSGNAVSIQLARNCLDCSENNQNRHRDSKTTFVSKEQSLSLVLASAREYIDSAGSLTDKSLALAKVCLNLIEYEHEEVLEELNLVKSFQLLHEFNLKMLPIQVRLCSDRLRLIADCLKKKPGAHRNPQKLLQLAAFLNIYGKNSKQRQGNVLVLVAETAFAAKDMRCCAEVCTQIVQAEYSPGWHIVAELGRCTEFPNVVVREKLLSFALRHCPPEMLSKLIDDRGSLEVESLQHVVNRLLVVRGATTQLEADENDTECEAPTKGNSEPPMPYSGDFLSSLKIGEATVREKTHRLLSRVGDTQFWKKAFQIGWDTGSENKQSGAPPPLSVQSFHAFYSSLFDSTPYCLSVLGPRYDSVVAPDIPPHIRLEQALLRISLLELSAGVEHHNLPDILARNAQSLLPEDNFLAIAHLLAIPEPTAKEVHEQIFSACATHISLQLAQYHAAVRIFQDITEKQMDLRDIFLYDPNELIRNMSKVNENASDWTLILSRWKARSIDLMEGQQLQKLGCGVDLERFSCDAQYRQDSILGLAMSEDSDRLVLALALAARHNVTRTQVIAEHVAGVLLSDFSTDEISDRLENDQVQKLIFEAAEDVKLKLEDSVFHMLSGIQLNHLKLLFGLLNKVAPDHRVGRLFPRDHLKLLSKVLSISNDIDYKLLISGPKNTLHAIENSLSDKNIPLIHKLLKAMPVSLVEQLSTSQLYSILVKRMLSKRQGPSGNLDEVLPLLHKMAASDLQNLTESICFSDDVKSYQLNALDLHISLVVAALLICNQNIKNEVDNESISEDWHHSAQHFERLKEHLVSSKELLINWPNEELCRKYLDSRGDWSKIGELLETGLLMKNFHIDIILAIAKTVPAVEFSVEFIITRRLKYILEHISSYNEELNSNLDTLLLRIEVMLNVGCPLHSDWTPLLQSLAAQELLPSEIRLRILHFLRSEEESGENYLLLHTRAIVAGAWTQIPTIKSSEIGEEVARAKLLFTLLDHTSDWKQRSAICKLIELWPPFKERNLHGKVIQNVLLNCLKCDDGEWNEQKMKFIMDIIPQRYQLTHADVMFLMEEANIDAIEEDNDDEQTINVQLLLLVCLLCEDSSAHQKAVSLVQQKLTERLEDAVADLIISRNLVTQLISSPAYSQLLSTLLAAKPECAPDLIETLRRRNYFAEAGSVILQSVRQVPQFMRIFSTALSLGVSDDPWQSKSNARVQISSSEKSGQESGAMAEGNMWDSDGEWDEVERETFDKKVQNPPGKDDQPHASDWSEDDWGDWTQEDAEVKPDIQSKRKSLADVKKHSSGVTVESAHEEESSKNSFFSTPSGEKVLLGSPRSAFARITRSMSKSSESKSGSPASSEEKTDSSKEEKPKDSSEGWEDEWGDNWED